MPAFAPAPFVFTSTSSRVVNIDASTFPTCTVNDGGNSQTVSFDQLSDYIYQSDGDFILTDFSVNVGLVGYSSVRVIPYPYKYMPLSALPSGYSYVNGVFTAPEASSGGTSATVDLNSVYTAINNAVDLISTMISNKGDDVIRNIPNMDTSAIQTNLDLIKSYTDTLETDMAIVKTRVGELPTLLGGLAVNSLNGNGCEFKDGVQVNVTGRTGIFTVKNSTYFLLDDNTYTVLYELNSPNGGTVKVPETLCTLYVAPVTPDGTITIG